MEKIDWEKISFEIITESGAAKSSAMEGLFSAKKGDFEIAESKIKEANERIGEASHIHFRVIQSEAKGEQLEYKVLFIHAEDQLLTTQTLILLVGEMIDMYKKIFNKN